MKEIKDIAVKLFTLNDDKVCECNGKHEVCLFCNKCRSDNEVQVLSDYSELNHCIDHTILRANACTTEVKNLCDEANQYKFKSVCVNPCFVNFVKFNLRTPLVCTVIGFPLGANYSEVKIYEAAKAIEAGADEIDMVINIGLLKENFYQYIFEEILHISSLCVQKNVVLKVILETCLLSKEEIIKACLIAKKAGADFVKTSTEIGRAHV